MTLVLIQLGHDADILLRIFTSIFIKDIGLYFSFLVVCLCGFDGDGGGFIK